MLQALVELNAHGRRALGALLEKQQTTPEYYPLTLNALISACNQTTNRNPVMALQRFEVLAALHALERANLVERVTGPRADRWSHMVIQPVLTRPANKALLTTLLLRGAQTPGELKARSDRMHSFQSLPEVEQTLEELSGTSPPLVRCLGRKPGQKESRWTLVLAGDEVEEPPGPDLELEEKEGLSLEERVERLEVQLAAISKRLDSLEG